MDAGAGPAAGYEAQARALCEVGRLFGQRQWCLATGGNFSLRLDEASCLITRSGSDKSELTADDLIVCGLDGVAADPALKPSAETALHACLYALDGAIGAVLHTHSVTATVVSRAMPGELVVQGLEMQKALDGIATHEDKLVLPILENSRDMAALKAAVRQRYALGHLRSHGFLVRGHGLYAWGADLATARRHVEGLEFLLSCIWAERLLGK